MSWQSVRLELDRTRDFPRGSAGRAYLLRLPLLADGTIDDEAMARTPERATMRRMWPNEPDRSGHIQRLGDGWACISEGNGHESLIVSRFPFQQLKEGEPILLTESDGQRLPFRITKLRPFAPRP